MRERVAELESSVAALASEVAALRRRVVALEAGAPAATQPAALAVIPEVGAAEVQGWLSLLGRTLVILGGAYLLRAITSAQVVSYTAGVAAGLLYGAPWLLLASRAGARNRRLDAFCYGLSTALIGYPLVWEATARFAVFTAGESALVLGGLTAAALVRSAVWRLHSLAAIVTCGALASAFALGVATGQWLPYTVLAIAIGLATLWLGYVRDWVGLRWPAALVADAMIVVLAGRPSAGFWLVLLAQLLAIVGYLGSFAFRTLRRRRTVIPFEIAQSVGILALVVPSLFAFVAARPAGVITAAAVVLAAGIATYVVMFTMVERQAGIANQFFYSLLALVLSAAGALILMPRLAPALLAAGAAAAAVVARRRVPIVLWTQAALLIVAAGASSGLFAAVTAALVASPHIWPRFGPAAWVTLACAIAVFVVHPRREGPASEAIAVPRVLLSLLAVWAAAGAIVYAAGIALQQTDGWDAAWLATVRTTIAVAATLGVAYASRQKGWREAGWLTYPLLVLLGAKLLLSDFPSGRPVTLFIALAAYGLALIAAPRALRRPLAAPPPQEYAAVQ